MVAGSVPLAELPEHIHRVRADVLATCGVGGGLHALDWLVIAGGIVSVAGQYSGWPTAKAARRVDATSERLTRLLDAAPCAGMEPGRAAIVRTAPRRRSAGVAHARAE